MSVELNGAPSVNNLSREPTAHQANKQTVSKKKTKGYGSAKCITNTLHVVQNIYALVVTSCATSAL